MRSYKGAEMKKEMTYEQIFVTSRDEMEEIMKEVREKYKNDKVFERNLISNPTETLKKEGLELQKGISFQIVKTEEEANLLPGNVVPLSFDNNNKDSLSLEELDNIAGGVVTNFTGKSGATKSFTQEEYRKLSKAELDKIWTLEW